MDGTSERHWPNCRGLAKQLKIDTNKMTDKYRKDFPACLIDDLSRIFFLIMIIYKLSYFVKGLAKQLKIGTN